MIRQCLRTVIAGATARMHSSVPVRLMSVDPVVVH
jgi:hypothetical protein